MRICPKCGSTEVIPIGGGILGSWECEKCRFSGILFPEVEKLKKEDKKKTRIKKKK